MSLNGLQNIIDGFQSGKATSINTSLKSLTSLLDNNDPNQVFNRWKKDNPGRKDREILAPLFAALWQVLAKERAAAYKGTAAAENRASTAAKLIRTLLEKMEPRLGLTAVRQHIPKLLLEAVRGDHDLDKFSALHLTKALRTLLENPAHVARLPSLLWVEIVEFAFNVILGDDPKAPLCQTKEDEDEKKGLDRFYASESDEEPPTKRAKTSSSKPAKAPSLKAPASNSRLPSPSPWSSAHSPADRYDMNVRVELLGCLSSLLRHSSSRLLYQFQRELHDKPSKLQEARLNALAQNLPFAVLFRMQRFFECYPVDSSLQWDYLSCLLSVLSTLTPNKRATVEVFACQAWPSLALLWKSKDRRTKESLVGIFRVLFAYGETANDKLRLEWLSGVGQLWQMLNDEPNQRWPVEMLAIDSIRLEPTSPSDPDQETKSFVASTFKLASGVDANQALAWALLELQADCTKTLYENPTTLKITGTQSQTGKKRGTSSNVLTATLDSIASPANEATSRIFHLQVLLFFIDRHWNLPHSALRSQIVSQLLQLVAVDDAAIQSWSFLCLAAITHTSTVLGQTNSDIPELLTDHSTWDNIWTHSIRRVNVPALSRAACHSAYTLLLCTNKRERTRTRPTLQINRILAEIETLGKDLDVQGPAYPCDSVCMFLSECLRLASQDVRLYRLQLNEKALQWLLYAWHVTQSDSSKLNVNDILLLLSTICSFERRIPLIEPISLPQCRIVEVLVEFHEALVAREFVLYAKLPVFRPAKIQMDPEKESNQLPQTQLEASPDDDDPMGDLPYTEFDLVPAREAEKRASEFFQRTIDNLSTDWESSITTNVSPSADMASSTLRFATAALAFDGLMTLNGIHSNKRLMQTAAKLASIIAAFANGSQTWSIFERVKVLRALEPLILREARQSIRPLEAMGKPSSGTDVPRRVLRKLTLEEPNDLRSLRVSLQKIVWSGTEMQDSFEPALDALTALLGECMTPQSSGITTGVDNDFAPIRTSGGQSNEESSTETGVIDLASLCVTFLAAVPSFQSLSGQSSRAHELIEKVSLGLDSERFFHCIPTLFDLVGCGVLKLSPRDLGDVFEDCLKKLEGYHLTLKDEVLFAVLHAVRSTVVLWLHPDYEPYRSRVLEVIKHVIQKNETGLIHSWRLRDLVLQIIDEFLPKDTSGVVTSFSLFSNGNAMPVDGAPPLPDFFLAMMHLMNDDDIRVRVRAAPANAKLFFLEDVVQRHPLDFYVDWRKHLPEELDREEFILTRLLTLGNVILSCAAVRRGPIWHFLETYLATKDSAQHMNTDHWHTILSAIATRMGLINASKLMEAYVSQFAFVLRKEGHSLFGLPPRMFGYSDGVAFAKAIASRFAAPTLAGLSGESERATATGQNAFEALCNYLHKTPSQGFIEHFGEVVGLHIISSSSTNSLSGLNGTLISRAQHFIDAVTFEEALKSQFPLVMLAIVRGLGDNDTGANSAISNALVQSTSAPPLANHVFRELTRFRQTSDHRPYPPNTPNFAIGLILESINWLKQRVPSHDIKAASYHILRHLFKEIQDAIIVNEKFRLLNALCLWIALHYDEISDPTLLHVVIHGTTFLLQEEELVHSAQSILDWALQSYAKQKSPNSRFPDLLIRICCLMQDYVEKSSVGHSGLLNWLDNSVYSIAQNHGLKRQILEALPAWPYVPSAKLHSISSQATASDVSRALNDPSLSSNKFRLVRKLRDLGSKDSTSTEFGNLDFWTLKHHIPSRDYLEREDMLAFAKLLHHHHGHIEVFVDDGTETSAHFLAHNNSPQSAIINALLRLQASSSDERSYCAYTTLCHVLAVAKLKPILSSLPNDARPELDMLHMYPPNPIVCEGHDIVTSLADPATVEMAKHFSSWIGHQCTLLAKELSKRDPVYAQLLDIFQQNEDFAHDMIPVLVHATLQDRGNQLDQSQIRRSLSTYFIDVLQTSSASTAAIQTIVNIVLYLRHFQPPSQSLTHDQWLDLDYQLLARKAGHCGAYTTSILFLELAVEYAADNNTLNNDDVLYEIYKHIDEPDGFYGIQTADLQQFLLKRFHHEHQWEKAFRFHGAQMEAGGGNASTGLLQTFASFGMDRLAMNTLSSTSANATTDMNPSSMNYRLGWKTERWDLPLPEEHSADASLYVALRAIYRERDPVVVRQIVQSSMLWDMEHLKLLGTENLAEIRELTRNIMSLNEIYQWANLSNEQRIGLPESWSSVVPEFDFPDTELLMMTRMSLLRSLSQKEAQQQVGPVLSPELIALRSLETSCFVHLSEAARKAGRGQIALNSIIQAQAVQVDPNDSRVASEFANVLWHDKEENMAVQTLQAFVGRHYVQGSSLDAKERIDKAVILTRLGRWMSEACIAKPTDIRQDYFQPAVYLLSSSEPNDASAKDRGSVYHQFASFADAQYQAVMNSPEMIRRRIYIERKNVEVKYLNDILPVAKAQQHSDPDRFKRIAQQLNKAKRQLANDSAIFENASGALKSFLNQALDMYSRCLEICDDYDDTAPLGFCSLWFANFHAPDLEEKMETCLDRVESRKMVFLIHQISSRLTNSESSNTSKNQAILQKLLLRMGREHPFHCIYSIFCIQSRLKKSEPTARRSSGRHASEPPGQAHPERMEAAFELLEKLKQDPHVSERVQETLKVCAAYLEWADFSLKDGINGFEATTKNPIKIPSHLDILKLKNTAVPVLTAHTPIDPTKEYRNLDYVVRYEQNFSLAGGINLPKINVCVGSIRPRHKQLFKGGKGADDLRQDAVMEQVFDLVNIVLRRDRETRKRNLNIRAYTVVPLAATAGVLEFVDNTQVLSGWLNPAHEKYHPEQGSANSIAAKMVEIRRTKLTRSAADKDMECVKYFKENMKRFSPVMRHWFYEKTKVPMAWFRMRLNYTRSVATTSIVGHVLGLGDRHSSNILMDNETGEAVHIDLGIAFEQGKLLNVPEIVPFRLTQDMVDGMGMSGTRGVFQRCTEETLRVLRERSDVIMTVLEVFRHDPLHSWTASEGKIQKAQDPERKAEGRGRSLKSTKHEPSVTTLAPAGLGEIKLSMESDSVEENADRALSAVKRKLDTTMSVAYTVNELIAEATSLDNLGRMYGGWAPQL